MTGKQLKNSILQWAIQGKLVPQNPNDEPASVLLEKIRAEKARLVKEGKLKKKDLEVKPIAEDEIPFEIPKEWEWVRLSMFCTRFSTGPFGTMVHKEDYVDTNGHPLINPTNIKNGRICCDGIKMVSDNKYNELSSYTLQTDDIVLARRGDLSKIAVVSKNECGWLAGTGAFFMHFVEVLTLPYFVYLYTSSYCQNYLLAQSVGGTMNNLNQTLLSDFLVPLPPLAEQHRIVAKIEELMPLVEKYGAAQDALEEWNNALPEKLKKSVRQEAIQGRLVPQDPSDEPASALLERIREEKQRLVKEGKLKKKDLEVKPIEEDEVPFEIPRSWECVRLTDICQLNDGEKRTEPHVCMDAKFLRGKKNGEIVSSGKYVQKGDHIILVDGENSGEVFTTPCDGYMGSTFKQLWISDAMYLPYVLYFIRFYKELLRNSKKGAAIPHLNKEIFYSLPIGIPPLAEQRRIVAKIEELFGVIKK